METRRDSGMYAVGAPEVVPVDDFDQAREAISPADRLHLIRARSLRFRERLLSTDCVLYCQSFDLVGFPYPTRFGLLNAFSGASPLMHLINRMIVVQYRSEAGVKTLLFSPSDIHRNRETPYFKRLSRAAGPLASFTDKLLAARHSTVQHALASVGLRPEDIDYITYDHLHTQDLRGWLGSCGEPGYFPNAKLLIMRQEWESTRGLLPPQRDWYCPDGMDGIDGRRVVLLDTDVVLGEGVALVQTPGHTEGNHSLVLHTDKGLLVSSENGVAADSYAPLKSRIPGVREYARNTGMEVVLNGNTLERGIDQYLSMIKEKTIAGPCPDNPDFCNFYPSSELTPFRLFPGIKPTFSLGPLRFGEPLCAGEQSVRGTGSRGAAA